MREQWNCNNDNEREEGDLEEPWMNAEFLHLTRRQQNCEIYRVVASAVLSMSAEVAASRSRLEELLTRREECGLAESGQEKKASNHHPDTSRQFEFQVIHGEDNQDTQVK